MRLRIGREIGVITETAEINFERSLACWRVLSDRLATARCLHNLANVVKVRGDYPRARGHYVRQLRFLKISAIARRRMVN